MARPKRNQEGLSAKARIEEAFWGMMEEVPYDAITITTLARRARVNHNTIYYYYENMDHLATQLLEENIPKNIGEIFGNVIVQGTGFFEQCLADPQLFRRWQRVGLLLMSGSSFLMEHVKEKLIRTWCETMETTPENLTRAQRMDLEFIFSGMMALMKLALQEKDLSDFPTMLERPLGQVIRATLAALRQNTEK